MRKWPLLLVLSAGGALAGFVACGGSSDNPPANTDAGTTVDAGKDTSTTGTVDSGSDTGTDAGTTACLDAGNLDDFDAGDAALGDAGASIGLCLACTKSNCSAQVTECNADCYCPGDLETFFGCISTGGSLITCGSDLYNNADTAEQDLGGCVVQSCATPCNLNFTLDSGVHDSGSHDGSTDGSTDSGHD